MAAIFKHAVVRIEVCGKTLVNNNAFMKLVCIYITKVSSIS